MINFPVDYRAEAFLPLQMVAMPFQKCIDKKGVIVISTDLKDPGVKKVQVPRL